MEAGSAAIVPGQPDISDRYPANYLSFEDIETQYPGCVAAGRLAVWACTHRYNFHRIVTKVGRNSRVRRDRWEQFLDSRTIGAATEVVAYRKAKISSIKERSSDKPARSCGVQGCQGPAGLQALACVLRASITRHEETVQEGSK